MKRSEMCNLIYKTIREFNATCEGPQEAKDVFIAVEVLNVIEKAGMQPPKIIRELKGGYGINDCTRVIKKDNDYVGACEVNQWENEK